MSNSIILTAEKLAEEKAKNGLTRESKVYLGNGHEAVKNASQLTAKVALENEAGESVESDSILYKVGSAAWKNSDARFALYRDLKALQNKALSEIQANGAPSPTTLATYFAKLFIDVNRQADMLADYSSRIYNVLQREDAQEVTYLRDLIPFVGKEEVIKGEGDPVPLIQENLANSAAITLYFKAFGHKSSIKSMLFSPIDKAQRIAEAAATINVDSRNNDIIGHLVGLSFVTSGTPKHYQAKDATSGATFDVLMYNTFRKALKKLGALKHPLTGQLLSNLGAFAGGAKILCHPTDAWAIERAIMGELSGAGGLLQIARALPFSEIIPYGGGIQNGLTWGKQTLSLPGVTQGYAYIFLPNPLGGFVLDKRTQTMEMGAGSVLELSTEERAWYRINGLYHDWFEGDLATDAVGTGCVVKVELPTE